MRAKALKKYIKTSPRKMRLVVDLIRGKKADEAINILKYTPNHAAEFALGVLKSAIGNINSKKESVDAGMTYDASELVVREAFVNAGPTMKRISPAPMGRAYRIRKRSNHLTIVVELLDNNDNTSTEE